MDRFNLNAVEIIKKMHIQFILMKMENQTVIWQLLIQVDLQILLTLILDSDLKDVLQQTLMSENRKELKKINARIMKWREMLTNGLHRDPELLIKRTRKGIPTSMRMKVWPQLVSGKISQRKAMSYSKVLIKDSMDVYDINLDIPRTFSFESQEILKESLFEVLKALSIEFPEIGYCQGMNFLAMRLIQILDDDSTFYLMTYILRRNHSIYDNFRNPGFVSRQNSVYTELLRQFMPKVQAKLKQQNMDPIMYTPSWLLTLFSKSLSQEKFYRFFECFLVEGYCFLYKMVLAFIKMKEKNILSNSMEDNFTLLPDMEFFNSVDDDVLIQTAAQFEITNAEIKKMEETYNKDNKKNIQSIEKSCEQSYKKKLLCPRRNFEWTIEDFQKTRVSLVKFDD